MGSGSCASNRPEALLKKQLRAQQRKFDIFDIPVPKLNVLLKAIESNILWWVSTAPISLTFVLDPVRLSSYFLQNSNNFSPI